MSLIRKKQKRLRVSFAAQHRQRRALLVEASTQTLEPENKNQTQYASCPNDPPVCRQIPEIRHFSYDYEEHEPCLEVDTSPQDLSIGDALHEEVLEVLGQEGEESGSVLNLHQGRYLLENHLVGVRGNLRSGFFQSYVPNELID